MYEEKGVVFLIVYVNWSVYKKGIELIVTVKIGKRIILIPINIIRIVQS